MRTPPLPRAVRAGWPRISFRSAYHRRVTLAGALVLVLVLAATVVIGVERARSAPVWSQRSAGRPVPTSAPPASAAATAVPSSSGPTASAAGSPAWTLPNGPAPIPPAPIRPLTDEVSRCAAATVATLGPAARVGQLLMIGIPVARPQGLAQSVGRYGLGGAFLAGQRAGPAATLRADLGVLQRAATDGGRLPLHIAVDQEGGTVQRLQGTDFPAIPSAVDQGRWDAAMLRVRTGDWAGRIAAAGVTMDLAPVADTVPADLGAGNPPIGALDREYGSAPERVAADIAVVVPAMQGAGVLATLKHFPGLGRVRANTDTSDAAVDPGTTPTDPTLTPFSRGIGAGSGAVMISSAHYPALDAQAIAAFSRPIITDLLRQRLGYQGLVISDDLGAAKAVTAVPVGERATRFVAAGGDMVLTIRSSDAPIMADALLARAQASPAFAARVTEAAEHVVRSKLQAGLLGCR